MKLQQATQILSDHQIWRKGAETEPTDPIQLGIAIDVILNQLEVHKEQITNAYRSGIWMTDTAEQYYNEIFKD